MSISETLDPVPPSNQLTDPKFEPVSELAEHEDAAKSDHPVASNQSGQFTPPNVPPSDLAADPAAHDVTKKQDDLSGSDPSGADHATVKAEQGILTPHYGPDIANMGSTTLDPNQMYSLQPGPPQGSQQQSASGSGYSSSLGSSGVSAPASETDGQMFHPPFVVNLDMVKRTMDGVNRLLGVDLSDTEVSESALLDDPNKDMLNDDVRGNGLAMDQKDPVVIAAKGEYSHMRLICDACGHIVAAVGRAVLDAARESFEEGLKQGTPGMPPKPPVRKKRGGILGFKELAARANLSPWHFHRVFRVTTGVTPKTYGEALWEYLMIESGFNLENEELTIDRNLNGKPGSSLSQGISPSSSSSPQSPIMATSQVSPNSSSRSPPISSAVMGTSGAPQSAAHAQTLTQNGGAPGNGRVRKARSRSRPSRSRSRTRSQTQSQVLTTLSAIGDAAATADPGPRGRSFSRGVHTPVSVSQGVLSSAGVNGSQGHPAAMPPPPPPQQQLGSDTVGSTAFDADWFGPPDDLLSGLGGPAGGAQNNNMSMAHMGTQDLDAPDLTALSLQQLGLDPPTGPADMNDMRQRTDTSNWHMPNTVNPMGSPQALASSAPDLTILGSMYGNPSSRMERFKSPESIANGERNHQMSNSFGMHNFQAPSQGMYDDTSGMNSYVGSLNMNSFHRDNDFSVPRGMHMQQHMGMNQGYPHNTMSPSGASSFNEEAPSVMGSNAIDSHMPSGSNASSMHSMHENLHENLQPSYRGSMHENLQDNFQENLQQEMFQQQQHQQQGDGLGGLSDLPASYYLSSKDSPKYEDTSKQEDDAFVSALIGDDPPMLASWNEADENQNQDFGF